MIQTKSKPAKRSPLEAWRRGLGQSRKELAAWLGGTSSGKMIALELAHLEGGLSNPEFVLFADILPPEILEAQKHWFDKFGICLQKGKSA